MFMIVDYMKRYYETHPFPTTGGITAPEALTGGYLEWLNLSNDERALWIEKFKDMKAEGKSLFTLQNEYYYIYSKRPRPGESRIAPSGSPGFGPRFQPPGVRPMPNTAETVHNHKLPNTWHPLSPQDQVPSSDVGIHTRFPAPSTPDLANKQSPVVASSVNYPSRFQQGLQGAQDWMWKNKPKELSHQEC